MLLICWCLTAGDGPRAHLQRLAECIRWSYGMGIVLRLGNIARLELNYCFPMGVQPGDRLVWYNSFCRGSCTPICFLRECCDTWVCLVRTNRDILVLLSQPALLSLVAQLGSDFASQMPQFIYLESSS